MEQNGSKVKWSSCDVNLSMDQFERLVENYSRRQLTYDTDVHDAFVGITEGLPDESTWGIPHSKFEEYLHWDGIEQTGRPALIWRNIPLAPGWSWMTWKGYIHLQPSMVLHTPEISCYQSYWTNTDAGSIIRKISNLDVSPDTLIKIRLAHSMIYPKSPS